MDKIWLRQYPESIPKTIQPERYQSLIDLFQKSVTAFADRPAVYNQGVTLTYRQLDQYARAFCNYLSEACHVKKGDRLILMLPNTLHYPIAMLGAWYAGLVIVNLNPLYTVSELQIQLRLVHAESIVVLAPFANKIEKLLPEFTFLKNIFVANIEDFVSQPKAWFIHLYLKYIKKILPASHFKESVSFKQALRIGQSMVHRSVSLVSQDIAFLQLTGGTTGIPKAAMLTHRNMIANILQADAWFSPLLKKGEEIMITALPLYHIFSLMANGLFMLHIGGFSILITDPRNMKNTLSEMKRFPFTSITGVNTLFEAFLKQTRFSQLNFQSLKLCIGGGMAMKSSTVKHWKAVTGVTILEAYGLTETSPAVTINPVFLNSYNGSIGLPLPSTDIRILDAEKNDVPVGQVGELAVKGPQVMHEYFENPDETRKAFTSDGFFLTGDIVSINQEGYLYYKTRKKEMIVVSGFNVYPHEIEEVLSKNPSVSEAVVVGVPDELTGEALKAVIVKKDTDLTEKEIRQFFHEYLTGYKIPKLIEFRDELPKTPIGKVMRHELRYRI